MKSKRRFLSKPLKGHVYILPSNPPHVQLLVVAEGEGVFLKLVGDVNLDEKTGQLVTTFTNTPELPFTDFKLSFSGGAQAALSTPTRCGTYRTTSDFTAWATPMVEDVFPSSDFLVSAGTGDAACPGGRGVFAVWSVDDRWFYDRSGWWVYELLVVVDAA